MWFNVSVNKVMNRYGCSVIPGKDSCPQGFWGHVKSQKQTCLYHWENRKTWGVTEDRGVENSGRRHQMEEREVGRCHYP